ncbi:MAG: pitrilysin family protein [Gemmatimonadota bacterium]
MKMIGSALAVLVVAAPLAAQVAPPQPGTPREFRVPAPTEFTLDNGLRVTMVQYGAVPKVNVQVVVRTGNIDEAPNEVWLADLTGDLMEEGTVSMDAGAVAEAAASMGGAVSVGVGMDQSFVTGTALSEFGPDMVRLVADVIRSPRFPEDELERLKGDRIRSLSISKSQPQSQALERFRAVLYPNHAYGRIFPTEDMVRGYDVDQVRAFYGGNYGAMRSRLFVVGRFDPDAVEEAVREAFGTWERGSDAAPAVAQSSGTRAVYFVDNPGAVQSTLYVGLPVIDPSHPDFVGLQVTNALLGGSFGSRITSNIREDKGYTYSPFSTLSSRWRDAYWAEVADVTTDVTGAALGEIFLEIDRLRSEAPPADELTSIQNYMAGTFVLQNSSRGGIINQLNFVALHGVGEEYLRAYVDRVYAVTPQEVQRMAQEYLDPQDMVIVVVGDRTQVLDQVREFGDLIE